MIEDMVLVARGKVVSSTIRRLLHVSMPRASTSKGFINYRGVTPDRYYNFRLDTCLIKASLTLPFTTSAIPSIFSTKHLQTLKALHLCVVEQLLCIGIERGPAVPLTLNLRPSVLQVFDTEVIERMTLKTNVVAGAGVAPTAPAYETSKEYAAPINRPAVWGRICNVS